jgi:predicted phage gp36 major capsid-like protein
MNQAAATIREVNDAFLAFVRELGGAEHLPGKFTLDGPGMRALEQAIDAAVISGDLQKTEDLCDEYKARFLAYIEKWRAKVNHREEVAA